MQETLLAVHNQRHTYDAAQPLTAWVHAIARYKLDRLPAPPRRARGAERPARRTTTSSSPPPTPRPLEARRDLARLLERLPDRHRLPIIHVKIEGLSVAETAKLTGMSESAVKVGVHRGLKALAAFVRKQA